MPVDFEFLGEDGILVRGIGVVAAREVAAVNRAIYKDPERIKKIDFQLVDLTGAVAVESTPQGIKQLAEQDKQAASINPHMAIAVIGSRDVVYGLARMWETYVDDAPMDVHVFRTMEEAEAWIVELRAEKAAVG